VFRRLLLPAAAFLVLALPAPASAIVNGDTAQEGDYPAQGFLGIDSNGNGFVDSFCSGTLVGSRQFLTAARCTTNSLGQGRPATSFTVQIGEIALPDATVVENVAANDIPDPLEIPPNGYVRPTGENDIAMLTLKAPVDTDLVRVVDSSETAAWAPDTAGRVLGWGEIMQDGDISETLLTGEVVVRPDSDCPNANFDATVMLCAAGTVATGDANPCTSDSGSPLLVQDGSALAGVFSGAACATTAEPGIFARVGADPLNAWIHDRTPEADFDFDRQPQANVPVTLFSTSRYPPPGTDGDDFFDTVKWDFDGDREFDDETGERISHTFRTPGEVVVGIEASNAAAGDKASAYFAFDVDPDPNAPPPTPAQPGATPPPPATKTPVVRLATISAAKRPKVRRGRFHIRVKFARTAPRGTAVVEAFRGRRLIGIGRTRVRRGATKRVTVKLTTTGKRLLRGSATKRLKVRVRVRVGRRALRSKTLTLRR
jgi:hypothetical protein